MQPLLKGYFNRFKDTYDIQTLSPDETQQNLLERNAFKRFSNYTLFSVDDPDVFIGKTDLLDFVCVDDGPMSYIDGVGIKVNGRLVQSVEDVRRIIENSKKISVEFCFIHSSMEGLLDSVEVYTFGVGVKHFFSEKRYEESERIKEFRKLKDFIYNNEDVIGHLASNPSLVVYFVTSGKMPEDNKFSSTFQLIGEELHNTQDFLQSQQLVIIDGEKLLGFCRELENNFSIFLNMRDIIPLSVSGSAKIKKAYSFTCDAKEFLKILTKDDNTIRRSLFNDNVRDYLGGSAVNTEIESTIRHEPEMFLLYNNGITIVCSDFEQVREKLIRIDNPQIVNGCQTSSSIFNLRNLTTIDRIQLQVRIICTDDFIISNKVVRGTNKQNYVLDEAFETTRKFHQDLEAFFDFSQESDKLYYERRSKQYSSNPTIKKTHIVNLRIITQVFVSMFLNSPHEAHRHEAKLLEQYCSKNRRLIYNDKHELEPYYLCAMTWYKYEQYFRMEKIGKHYKPYKSHLYLLFRLSVGCMPPTLDAKEEIGTFCRKLRNILEEPEFGLHVQMSLRMFDTVREKWVQNGYSPSGMKDRREFSEMLIQIAASRFMDSKRRDNPSTQTFYPSYGCSDEKQTGIILRVKRQTPWCAYIRPDDGTENLRFDSRDFRGDVTILKENLEVCYVKVIRENGSIYADKVEIIE